MNGKKLCLEVIGRQTCHFKYSSVRPVTMALTRPEETRRVIRSTEAGN